MPAAATKVPSTATGRSQSARLARPAVSSNAPTASTSSWTGRGSTRSPCRTDSFLSHPHHVGLCERSCSTWTASSERQRRSDGLRKNTALANVVVDSERYWVARATEHILPRAVEEDVLIEEVTGLNVRDLSDHLDATYETLVDEDEFVTIYDEAAREVCRESVALLPGFEALVADISARSARRNRRRAARTATPVALVSSPVRWVELVLDRFDLADVFDVVVSAEHVESGKPAPDVYLRAAERLGVEPTERVAVEDSAHGIRAARRAGMTCVGLAGAAADAVAGDADDLAGASRSARRS